ncbi:Two-component system sensor histidine kinase/response regulator hybrid [uncultured Microcoleus sp.]|uniref:Circadian input-output histidine kinase CikA n=1 Tax=uncultured Microcoleus sp. TaxID=259945 RepID=A0A6J4MPU7_9CYAN|nr:Two-component system sensor histidine kinase/response regulator hybrid [uncultured Microcoleus sp.]
MIQQYQLVEQIFAGNSEMAMLMRSHDWSLSALGAVETWPQSLKTAIRIILGSRYPMFVWWGQQMTKFYNDAYIPVLGKRHPQALGQPASRVWAEIWDTLGPQAEAVLNQGQSTWNQELLLVMERNGYTEETYFTFSYSPVANDDGPVGGVFCACSEDTQRVLSDRRLATLRELAAETVTAKTQEAACEISATVLTNNAYDIPFALFYLLDGESEIARLAGTTRLAAGTLASCEAIELTSAQKCQWQLKLVMETGESRIIEDLEAQFGLLPGGAWSQSPHQAVVLPLARSGETFGFLIAGVSPLRTFDDDYKGFFDLMAGQVTTAIANAQAYEAERKRAEALAELDRAKTAFFSNVSHEFRTPLTLMLSPLEETIANLNGTIPPQEREQLQLVQRNGMRLLKLVNSLLDFSRLEAGRVQAAYEPIDLATYTAELASTFRSLIERVGMSLIVDCPPLAEAIYIDREMWEKIVLNLLSNAFKFTLAGTITVRLQCVENCVELSVADTGVGIPSEELPHLFERFHRIKNSQGRSFEGSGIGLSLVQELVKLHGGAIDVSSTFGQGSCFTVTIPTGTAHLPPERIGASRALASTALGAMPYIEEAQRWLPEGDFRLEEWSMAPSTHELVNQPAQSKIQNLKSKILLADDNADMRDYIRRLLSGSYIVQTVADGVAALTAIEKNPPDLVLTDVMMPGMDGFELLRSLRSNPATQDIPIILLSARAGEESRIEGLAAGADDYLIKPFSARELLARVEASLKLARLRQEATVRERTILGRVTDGFMALDLDFRFTYANQAAQRVSRTPLEAMLGKTMWEAFPGTIGNQFEIQYRRSLSEQIAVDFEEYYAPFDLWLEVHVYPSPTGLSLFFRDINDRKKIEQERERFLAVGSDLQVIAGINGYFHWVSPTFERTLGWTPDEMTSRPWTKFVHPDDLASSIAAADSPFSGNKTFTFENRYRHKDGSYRWLLWNAQPYPEEQVIYGAAVDITARKQAEATLRESEARLRFMLDASQIGDWDLDLTTQPYTAHRSLRHDQIFGYESLLPEWSYDIFLTHVHPDDRASVNEKFQETLWANTNWNFECRIIHADQSVHWIWVRSSVYCDSSGTPTRLLGIVMDITDGKRAEQALRESEEQSRNILESIGEAFLAVDENWRFTYVNQFAETLLDRIPGDLIGKNLWEEYPGVIGSEFEPIYLIPMRDRVPASLTAFYPDHDRWYEVRSYPAAHGITIYCKNVTDQIQAEAALRQSEERYRTLFESIDEGFCIIEVLFDANNTPIDYRFLEINPVFEQQTGIQQAVGKTVRQLVPDIEDHWIKIYGQVALTGESARFENGSEALNRWFDVYACRTGQPEARKVAVVFKDISDRKRIEAEREQLLQREQTAREAAERANRIKDEFLAVLSHELRTPLNPILGWSKLLQQNKLGAPKTASALASIERNAQLQLQLIDDLLDISRILSGKLSLKAMSVDLNMVISAALETVRLAAEAKSLQIQTTFSPSQGMVIGDSGRLQQVIWNLLSNAVKFTPQGGQITVRLTQTGTHAQIQVTDTGKGINPDFLPYVFEHFRQEDGATTRKFGGLGLGLAIARQVVEMHGGRIWGESRGEGQGATFTVELPLLRTANPVEEVAGRAEARWDDLHLASVRVLVVDDEQDSRDFVAFVAEQAGAKVTALGSAIEALQLLSTTPFDILLCDIGMPDMDGYMLVRQVRALPPEQGGQIPAIALTAYAGDFNQKQALAAGFQRHLAKPVEPNELVQAIVTLLSRLHR